MKKRVELSSYCFVVSALTIALLCGVFVYVLKQADHIWSAIVLGMVIIVLCLSTLFYMPLSISVDNKNLNINRSWRIKSIPIVDIAEVKLCQPTMGAIREGDTGKYFAYYGKSSDCFLVTLKDGRKYMLGCTDAPAMVQA